MHTVGVEAGGSFRPVGIYGFRPLEAHPQGGKLLATIRDSGLQSRYSGRLALSHSLSIFNGQRSLSMLKYGFLLIALEAVEGDFAHIFFFMSDRRLGRIYERFGLEFPEGLSFSDSKRLAGSYSLIEPQLSDVRGAVADFKMLFVYPRLP